MHSRAHELQVVHRAFAVLFLVAFAVQLPFCWILWDKLSGVAAAEAIGNYVLPILVVILLWFAFELSYWVPIAITSWYGAITILVKAITILGVILAAFPIDALYTTDFVQPFYAACILLAILYFKRGVPLRLSKSEVASSVIGVAMVALLFTSFDVLVLFTFRSFI
jgi:hypothetical protein